MKEALEHENGITVLGFKFKVVDEEEVRFLFCLASNVPYSLQHPRNFGLDLLTQIVEQHLTTPNSKFKAADLDKMVNVLVTVTDDSTVTLYFRTLARMST